MDRQTSVGPTTQLARHVSTLQLSDQMLEAKFRDCVSFSACAIPDRNVDHAIELIRDLENVADATEIIRMLVPIAAASRA
jgi:hypothetical protein